MYLRVAAVEPDIDKGFGHYPCYDLATLGNLLSSFTLRANL